MILTVLICMLVAITFGIGSYRIVLRSGFGWCEPRLAFRRRRRLARRFDSVFPDAIDMITQSLRAGMGLLQGLSLVADDGPEPLRSECRRVIHQVKKGEGIDDALREWRRQIPSEDLHMFVEAVLILRETGGNLVETFELIVKTIRERQRIAEKIRTATMQGLVQSAAIALLPILMIAVLSYAAAWYVRPLVTTVTGWLLLAAALFLQILGGIWLKKIVTIRI